MLITSRATAVIIASLAIAAAARAADAPAAAQPEQPPIMNLAGRAPEMDPFLALVGKWNVTQRFYRPKRGVWETGPEFPMEFRARYDGMYVEADAVLPVSPDQSFRNTMIISYDKFRRLYRVAMMDGLVGLMDIFEGVRQGDAVVVDDVRTNTPGPNMRGELEYVRMTFSFPAAGHFLIAAQAQRGGRWVDMLRYEMTRQP
jgi:hypothetical protein